MLHEVVSFKVGDTMEKLKPFCRCSFISQITRYSWEVSLRSRVELLVFNAVINVVCNSV